MTAATTERIDRTDETFHIELKPVADPAYRREGIRREPIKRLKRLLKFAGRECGFRIRWGRSPSPIELTDAEQPETPMIQFTDGPAAGRTLMLQRAPLFLRVTYDPNRLKWDALDQLADVPIAPEEITVYRRVGEPSAAYLDWTERGRRRGGKFAIATYVLASEQPDDATARDTKKWRKWCWAQVRAKPAAPAGTQQ